MPDITSGTHEVQGTTFMSVFDIQEAYYQISVAAVAWLVQEGLLIRLEDWVMSQGLVHPTLLVGPLREIKSRDLKREL